MGIGLLAPTAAFAQDSSPESKPTVSATVTQPEQGTIMPNFDHKVIAKSGINATSDYSVAIDSVSQAAVAAGQTVTITGHTTGFADGTWVNVWIKQANGTMYDAGGFITESSTFTTTATLMTPGNTTVQLSAGAYPAEQWSDNSVVNVREIQAGTYAYAIYHDLSGKPVLLSRANLQGVPAGPQGTNTVFHYSYPGVLRGEGAFSPTKVGNLPIYEQTWHLSEQGLSDWKAYPFRPADHQLVLRVTHGGANVGG